MTLQEIFDKSISHMLAQGSQSIANGSCKYRSGKKSCAIGCLFPDSVYKKEFDTNTNSAVNILVQDSPDFDFALKSVGIDTSNVKTINLLEDLQNIHDRTKKVHFMVDIKDGATRIAQEFGLTYNSESKT